MSLGPTKYTIVKCLSVLAGLGSEASDWLSATNKAPIGQPFTLGLVQTGISSTTMQGKKVEINLSGISVTSPVSGDIDPAWCNPGHRPV